MDRVELYLLCGYRRTGKDMLYNILNNKISCESIFKWRVYGKRGALALNINTSAKDYLRCAFADALKEEVETIYGIPKDIPDSDKDIRKYKHYLTGNIISARDACIEWGTIKREQDIDYWVSIICSQIIQNSSKNIYVLTDWRFINEVRYCEKMFETTTIRLYRSDIPTPPENISSEHSLNNYLTDYLLIRDDLIDEFEKTLKMMSYQIEYIPLDVRAEAAMELLLQKSTNAINNSTSLLELLNGISNNLPKVISKMALDLPFGSKHIDIIKRDLVQHIGYFMENFMFRDLPLVVEDGIAKITYAKEDINKWYKIHTEFWDIFTQPPDETFIIRIGPTQQDFPAKLEKESLIAIALSNEAYDNNDLLYLEDVLYSTDLVNYVDIDLETIVNNALNYRLALNKEKKKMPYTVNIRRRRHILSVNFSTLDFMYSIFFLAQITGLQNKGEGKIWSGLTIYQNGVNVPLSI